MVRNDEGKGRKGEDTLSPRTLIQPYLKKKEKKKLLRILVFLNNKILCVQTCH